MDRDAQQRLRERDVAYSCFLFSGVVSLATAAASAIPMDTGTAGGLGILVFVPLFLGSFLTMLAGIGLALSIRTDRWLLTLSVLAALRVMDFFTEAGSVEVRNAIPVVYGLLVASVCAGWWVIRRRRFKAGF